MGGAGVRERSRVEFTSHVVHTLQGWDIVAYPVCCDYEYARVHASTEWLDKLELQTELVADFLRVQIRDWHGVVVVGRAECGRAVAQAAGEGWGQFRI